ncbi:hypothetical protein VR7878_02630 [Vibrio ruber DSM 16370]|uniref:Uncharacterized protein n=1 Tax=Vibrio ruber (strain DSM 16370 / JCM 11486 / BCRC 17186 / CECT 7878 / LMG 23124 / VR1) TaxID=1123498 RepID=A0A1R4LN79_VIBR1|nr:hypothetical protein [Vibrio ruber]SJN58056.1 hypothetical protein VR7878_02630 [Vibrio ruber DSM 16370]
MTLRKTSGALCALFILSYGALNAWGTWGDIVEKMLAFFTITSIFFVIIALFGIFRGQLNLKEIELKIIACSFPVITLLEHVYPLIKYSDQKKDPDWLFSLGMDFSISVLVFYILWSNLKKCQ